MVSSAPMLIRVLASLAVAVVVWGAAAALSQEGSARDERTGGERPERDSQQPEPSADRPPVDPPDDPPTLRIPENLGSDLPPTGDDRIPERIRDALRQRGDHGETGDAILDGVLDAIRSQGSVLDGSPLDARQSVDEPRPRPELRPLPQEGFGRGSEEPRRDRRKSGYPGHDRSRVDAEAHFLLAEQLLKTARLLDALSDSDPARQRLIENLRGEAARILAAMRLPPSDVGPAPAGYGEPSRSY